jgi:hypothetical protein
MTPEQLLWDVSEAWLYWAETIHANRQGFVRVAGGRTVSDRARRAWEMTTGRKWNDET